jgi:glucose-1-phosphate cytidylyltransferase
VKSTSRLINGGFSSSIVACLTISIQECALETASERLAAEGSGSFRHHGFWIGMDTYRGYEMLNQVWDAGHAPWKVGDDQQDV